jgi:hypothetical protein
VFLEQLQSKKQVVPRQLLPQPLCPSLLLSQPPQKQALRLSKTTQLLLLKAGLTNSVLGAKNGNY